MTRIAAIGHVRGEVAALRPWLVDVRRDLHQHPELSWQEERTQRVILEQLHAMPDLADVRPIAKTGVTALVTGGMPGPCLLWRADIDALPLPEKTGLPFASNVENVMHACGHDTHIAMALGLGSILARHREKLAGAVRFIFQPAEEGDRGAQTCIEEGVLEKPHVARALGVHISADVPLGAINVAAGPFFASPTQFQVEITARGGHAAAPHQSVDAVVVAAHCVTALQTIVSRSVSPLDSAVLTIGTLKAGYRSNIIAESATMTGTIRSYTDAVRATMLRRTDEVFAGVCAAFGASYRFTQRTTCPPLVNDEVVTAVVRREAEHFFGAGNIYASPSMGAEDMADFLNARPGCFYWLGARNEAKGIVGRHHDPGFMVDEDALTIGVEFALRVIEANLKDLAASSER